MLSSIIAGLSALASITGFSSGTNFEVTADDYSIITETINSSVSFRDVTEIAKVKEYDDIYSIFGENRYLEVEINDIGYLIYDKQENVVAEYDPFNFTPYKDYDDDLKVYHYTVVDLTTNVIGVSPVNRGMYTTEQIKLVKRYLNDSAISYWLNTSEGNWADEITNRAKKIIKDTINANRPVLVNGSGHSTVAYGYDDDYVYVHTGWGFVAATPWATFTTKWFNNEFDTGAVDILLTGQHYHSDNYYSAYYDEYYCPDGYSFENLLLSPTDYAFEPQYFFYEKSIDVQKDGYIINTNRLRTGYIEEECINLSSRRQGAGVAYLEYYCPSYVKKIVVNVSFWSSSELYVSGIDTAIIQYMDSNGNWITAFNLLEDINLSKDRTNQDTIIVSFPKEVSNFRFYTENSAIGDRNKGRISIKDMEIMYA